MPQAKFYGTKDDAAIAVRADEQQTFRLLGSAYQADTMPDHP